jgi:class 3 adenylate cyclase
MKDGPPSCGDCGAGLPAGARFCPQCGARVAAATSPAPAAPGGERRPVAVLFADLAGFTKLTSEADAEVVHGLLGRFFELVDGAIARHGGSVDKHIGDATMGVFGAPVAHGNDVERAVSAACEIHEANAALSAELGKPLATHIGIASG